MELHHKRQRWTASLFGIRMRREVSIYYFFCLFFFIRQVCSASECAFNSSSSSFSFNSLICLFVFMNLHRNHWKRDGIEKERKAVFSTHDDQLECTIIQTSTWYESKSEYSIWYFQLKWMSENRETYIYESKIHLKPTDIKSVLKQMIGELNLVSWKQYVEENTTQKTTKELTHTHTHTDTDISDRSE